MDTLTPREISFILLALGTLLFSARLLGEIARRFNLPSVLGEILAGILLGPTVFGTFLPELSALLFPSRGGGALVLDGLTTLAIVLFLLVAGIEVDLSTVWRQGKVAIWIATVGMLVPFVLGFALAWFAPSMVGYQDGTDRIAFALFLATALSITALPIIAKILLDLKIYRSDLGVAVIAAAVFNDLLGWLVFAVILGMVGADHGLPIGHTILITVAFTAAMLTVIPWLIDRALPWIQAYTSWPAGVLSFALSLCLFSAAFTEWIGIHAIFGSFLAGVALGHSSHLRERTRTTLEQFISFIFAPLFFASIGLKVNFATHFNLLLTLTILTLALVGKVVGSTLGARMGRMPWREAWGAGFGMSAQGTMGIILGVLALQYHLITQELFVSLVVMALVTSMASGPLLQKVLRLKKPRRFVDFIDHGLFLSHVHAADRTAVIRELTSMMADALGFDRREIAEAVLSRERIMGTGIGQGIAVPHARLNGLKNPVVGLGLSATGIDFDAPDGQPARVVFLLLTPQNDNGAQLEILADIATTFKDDEVREKIHQVTGYTEFLALVKSAKR